MARDVEASPALSASEPDTRGGEPLEISAEAVARILERWPLARLATLAQDGAAKLVPVVFARSEGRLWTPVDGKPKRGAELSRIANVRRDARVALLFDHYDRDWSLLWWLRVEGEAEVVREQGDLLAAVAALREKYPQYAEGTDLFAGVPMLLAITPQRSTSWAASERAEARLIERLEASDG